MEEMMNSSHGNEYLVLLAIGRTANVAGLGLDKIGVHVVNGKVLVDEREQTNIPHIYALGDVATGMNLLHFYETKCISKTNYLDLPFPVPRYVRDFVYSSSFSSSSSEERI